MVVTKSADYITITHTNMKYGLLTVGSWSEESFADT